jgi:hypothetical protein
VLGCNTVYHLVKDTIKTAIDIVFKKTRNHTVDGPESIKNVKNKMAQT